VLEVFPGSEIVQNRVDKYPIQVIVTANIDGRKMEVWKGRQQNLFRKYHDARNKSMQEIKANLRILREELDDD
jgi:hypothetical protein